MVCLLAAHRQIQLELYSVNSRDSVFVFTKKEQKRPTAVWLFNVQGDAKHSLCFNSAIFCHIWKDLMNSYCLLLKTKKTGCGLAGGTVTAGGKRDSVKFSLGHIPHETLYLYLCVCICICVCELYLCFAENCLWFDWWQRRRGQRRLCIFHLFTSTPPALQCGKRETLVWLVKTSSSQKYFFSSPIFTKSTLIWSVVQRWQEWSSQRLNKWMQINSICKTEMLTLWFSGWAAAGAL